MPASRSPEHEQAVSKPVEPAVRCTAVEKEFHFYAHRADSLREAFVRLLLRQPLSKREAQFTLRGLDLQIARGESVAFVGSNGSGKSTTLRMIAGIYKPTRGVVETWGRVAAVIELGAGFHHELTGIENARLYGTVMGLDRRTLDQRLPQIEAFADIGDYIRTPVKYYSSGMYARLAFAVATCVEPDILLLDEVLAVGDASFRERCLDRLIAYRERGRTLVVVSHDADTLRKVCQRGVWLEKGRLRMDGPIDEVLHAYDAHWHEPVPPESREQAEEED
jgi:ABC-2 type transport system ATP-binding protein